MSKISHRIAVYWAVGAALGSFTAARGQNMDAGMIYSQGVQAYFAGQSGRAEGLLSTALALDPNDPRSYYFRALCELRQGRSDQAKSDMQMGAALEAQSPNRFAVGAALVRVQGADRLLLEQYRRDGRLAEASLRVHRDRTRYEQLRQREPVVLHQKATIPLDALLGANGSRPIVTFEQSPRPRTSLSASGASRIGAGAAAPADDPFHDDPTAPALRATPTNPAAGQSVAPSASGGPVLAQPPVPAKAVPDDDNPFGGPVSSDSAKQQPPPAGNATTPATPPNDDPFRSP
ncbi:MAG: hypothetical protein WD669_01705 [Pirellulales bacterium]